MSYTDGHTDERWVTLRDANAETQASVSALRKWYRNGTIKSEEREGPHGIQRYVWLADVKARQRAWAEAQEQMGRSPAPAPPATEPDEAADEPEVPAPGMLMVPMEAWQRTLDTVAGGMTALHQAGQELAEAREQAGVERTKAKFLAQQVDEWRSRADLAADELRQARAMAGDLAAELEVEKAKPRRRRWWGGRG